MNSNPLQPPTITAVLIEIAKLKNEHFDKLKLEVDSPNAFDSEKERIQVIAPQIEQDEDTVRYILSALSFFYTSLNRDNSERRDVREALSSYVDSVIEQDDLRKDDIPDDHVKQKIVDRLVVLLQKRDSIDNYNKHERLRWGFLPAALGFSTFVDLRPNLSDDMIAIDELIPVIQCQIRTDSLDPASKSFVFQMDSRSLKKLKDEIERAERKLSNIVTNESIKPLITKRRP